MTQKELLYVEDAVHHEQSMMCYLNFCISIVEEESLVSFFEHELKKHEALEQKLLNLLEVKSHE